MLPHVLMEWYGNLVIMNQLKKDVLKNADALKEWKWIIMTSVLLLMALQPIQKSNTLQKKYSDPSLLKVIINVYNVNNAYDDELHLHVFIF